MTIRLRSLAAHSLAGLMLAAAGCAPRPAVVTAPPTPAEAVPGPATTVFASSTALMPRAVTSFGAAALRGSVYAFGGYSGVPHAYSREGQSGELWRLDPDAQTFELVASSEPTQGAALVSTADALIRAGGMRARNARGEPDDIVSLDEVASFSPDSKTWTAWPPLPAARSSHAAALLGQTLYVVGGWQLSGSAQSGKFADSVLALDLSTRTYRSLPQPFALRALALAPLDGKLVALGGIDANGKVSREVHVFDPAKRELDARHRFPGRRLRRRRQLQWRRVVRQRARRRSCTRSPSRPAPGAQSPSSRFRASFTSSCSWARAASSRSAESRACTRARASARSRRSISRKASRAC